MKSDSKRRRARIASGIIFLVIVVAGVLSGTESTLVLQRANDGSVSAVDSWRYLGRVPVFWRSASQVREVKVQEAALSEADRRSSAHRDVWGLLTRSEEVVIVGATAFSYPYREDVSLVRAFLRNPANRSAEIRHPGDIRGRVASLVLLALAALSVVGLLWQWVTGRPPLAGAPRRVRPLPPAVGTAIFLAATLALVWFFSAGHRVFGPLATRKVQLLLTAAGADDTVGLSQAIASGVFLDARDDQDRTALMVAARAGADRAVQTLLAAGAHASLRDLEDRTALVIALQSEHVEVALRLLDAGSDFEAADLNGRTALHAAAELHDARVLQRLLALGVPVDLPDAHGWTALHFAAANGYPEALRVLLTAGADSRRRLPDGRTPLELAARDPGSQTLLTAAAALRPPLEARP